LHAIESMPEPSRSEFTVLKVDGKGMRLIHIPPVLVLNVYPKK
jgi:hypothetical protein